MREGQREGGKDEGLEARAERGRSGGREELKDGERKEGKEGGTGEGKGGLVQKLRPDLSLFKLNMDRIPSSLFSLFPCVCLFKDPLEGELAQP